jgi:formylglycine-generating enzyme required for sulfatase activity
LYARRTVLLEMMTRTLFASCAAAALLACSLALFFSPAPAPASDEPDIARIAPGPTKHRPAGDFNLNGRTLSPAPATVQFDEALHIMVRQVTVEEYGSCVADGACDALSAEGDASSALPAVGVNWFDAVAYAQWLSRRTGLRYRLPTDEEWAHAAGSKLPRGVESDVDDPNNPALRWLARYESEAGDQQGLASEPQPVGTYGVNENGLIDVAGNVWEWTSSCFVRGRLDETRRIEQVTITNCGVRVVQGRHRAYVPDFIRDAKGGGCTAGVPPANLGFRLVLESDSRMSLNRLVVRLRKRMDGILGTAERGLAMKDRGWKTASN